MTSTTGLSRAGPLDRSRQSSLDCGPTSLVPGLDTRMVGPRLRTGPVLSLGLVTALVAVAGLQSRFKQADLGRCLSVGSEMVGLPLLALRLHVPRPWLRPGWRDVLVSRVEYYMHVHVWWMRHVIPTR